MKIDEMDTDAWGIRTDFSDDAQWAHVCTLIAAPQSDDGYTFG